MKASGDQATYDGARIAVVWSLIIATLMEIAMAAAAMAAIFTRFLEKKVKARPGNARRDYTQSPRLFFFLVFKCPAASAFLFY